MPAMAMPLRAAPAEPIDGLQSGSRIRFDLRIGGGRSEMRRIRLVDTRALDQALRIEPPPEQLAPGAAVPDFSLTAQDGSQVALSALTGKLLAINFIYTRCPLPEVCPRLAASFASLQRRFRSQIPERLQLLSITLDPDYDTAPVLARYAASLRAHPQGWRFLTGTKDQIEKVARRFGLIHWPEEGVIVHTSVTALIGRDGRLAALVEGSNYRLEQLADLVSHHLAAEPE
jgi:protein SCO1/2